MFQSLIGRLQTGGERGQRLRGGGFQSLIGRLQTRSPYDYFRIVDEFQSLIGRLQTVGVYAEADGPECVSIPHR